MQNEPEWRKSQEEEFAFRVCLASELEGLKAVAFPCNLGLPATVLTKEDFGCYFCVGLRMTNHRF